MKTIWKYELDTDKEILSMPKNAEILCIQNQLGSTCLWAMVDPKAEKEDRCIEIFGTGTPIHVDMGIDRRYISTFQYGRLVFHAFERF